MIIIFAGVRSFLLKNKKFHENFPMPCSKAISKTDNK